MVDRDVVPRREGEELEPVLVNQSINVQSFRKRMTKKSEVEYLRQLGGWFLGYSVSNHRYPELQQSLASFLVNSAPVPRPEGTYPAPSSAAFLDPAYPCFALYRV